MIPPLLTLCLCLCLAACTSLPKAQQFEARYAPPQDKPGRLSALLTPAIEAHPGKSGLGLVPTAQGALRVRLAMIELAEHSLDLQYYIWRNDRAGFALLERLIEAAERGVRVRLLLDDHTLGADEEELAVLASLPNIDVKLYNPYGMRRSGSLSRTLTLLGDLNRLNHRMHNKVMLADNQLALTGGRNIGDAYFGLDFRRNFVDLDLFAAGPVVKDLSASFDRYWNSSWTRSMDELIDDTGTEEDKAELLDELRADIARRKSSRLPLPYVIDFSDQELEKAARRMPEDLLWGSTKVTADPPRKDLHRKLPDDAVAELLAQLGANAREEILWSSPYFVPGDLMVEAMENLVERGVQVRVLTNSLASTDVTVAHYGYANRREEVLDSGVELYETRPRSAAGLREQPEAMAKIPLALHAKVAVYDRRYVYIGSANLDPRSLVLNTEIGLVVDDPDLGEKVAQWLLAQMTPDSAYRVAKVGDRLCWHWREITTDWHQCQEPGNNLWHALAAWFVDLLPVEDQL